MNPLIWNLATETQVASAQASPATSYQLNPMPGGKFMVLCIEQNAGAPGSTNHNIGEIAGLADAQACAQADWDKGIRT